MNYTLIAPRTETSAVIQVLKNRGVENIEHYLKVSDNDIIDPKTIANMQDGAKMLISHISQGHKMHIVIDADCDGYTSAALLINYLYKLFPNYVSTKITYNVHKNKHHGIEIDAIDLDTTGLIVVPDASSNEYEIHEQLKQKGIDILIIDHHEAPKVSEYACVINNQLCDYSNKHLSGVGMVYKFCCYIDELLDVDYANEFLDLVALGNVADMVDLREYETRRLVNLGLGQVKNPYFKGMVTKNEYSIGNEVTPFAIAWYIAPYINAMCRSGDLDEKYIMFEAMLEHKAYMRVPSTKRGHKAGDTEILVEQACRVSTNVKNRQDKARDNIEEVIEAMIYKNNLLENKILLIQYEDGSAANIAGLVANSLMSKYQRPVLILSPRQHGDELWWEGSGRGPNLPGLESCREFYLESELVEYAEGHKNAFGLGVKDENLDKFLSWCNEKLKDFDFTPSYKADFIYNYQYLEDRKYDFIELIDYKYIWGQEVSQPYIVIENVIVNKDNLFLMKGTTSTLKITNPHYPDLDFIKKYSNEQEFESLYSEHGYVVLNIVGYCERNSWNNKPQILIKDYDIVDRKEYYF